MTASATTQAGQLPAHGRLDHRHRTQNRTTKYYVSHNEASQAQYIKIKPALPSLKNPSPSSTSRPNSATKSTPTSSPPHPSSSPTKTPASQPSHPATTRSSPPSKQADYKCTTRTATSPSSPPAAKTTLKPSYYLSHSTPLPALSTPSLKSISL